MTSNVTAAWTILNNTFTQTTIITTLLTDIAIPIILTLIITLIITRDIKKWPTIMLPTSLSLMALGLKTFVGIPIILVILAIINEIGINQGHNIINIAKATRRAAPNIAKAPAYTAGRIIGAITNRNNTKLTKMQNARLNSQIKQRFEQNTQGLQNLQGARIINTIPIGTNPQRTNKKRKTTIITTEDE